MKNPQQLHFDFGLWTLNMIQEIVKREFILVSINNFEI